MKVDETQQAGDFDVSATKRIVMSTPKSSVEVVLRCLARRNGLRLRREGFSEESKKDGNKYKVTKVYQRNLVAQTYNDNNRDSPRGRGSRSGRGRLRKDLEVLRWILK